MRLKPKNTNFNPRALLYRRYTDLQDSFSTSLVYRTQDGKFWLFSKENKGFLETDFPTNARIVEILPANKYVFQTTATDIQYFQYYNGWQVVEQGSPITLGGEILSKSIAKYQVNKYYYVGSFDFVIKGSIDGTTTQYIKGNIMPLQTLNIKYYTDDLTIQQDDLVVVEGRLYAVENPEKSVKRLPKPYNIYFATLNGIL